MINFWINLIFVIIAGVLVGYIVYMLRKNYNEKKLIVEAPEKIKKQDYLFFMGDGNKAKFKIEDITLERKRSIFNFFRKQKITKSKITGLEQEKIEIKNPEPQSIIIPQKERQITKPLFQEIQRIPEKLSNTIEKKRIKEKQRRLF